MARLPTLTRDELDPEAQALWDSLIQSRGSVGGPTACIMHHPALAAKSTPLGSQLRYNGVLAGADRELTILTAGREVEATYEWHAHEPIARADAALGRKGLVEMIVLAGYYGLVGFVLNGFEVDLPEGATPAFER